MNSLIFPIFKKLIYLFLDWLLDGDVSVEFWSGDILLHTESTTSSNLNGPSHQVLMAIITLHLL
jgi:hypothetical protein